MKSLTRDQMENLDRPFCDAKQMIEFCLDRIHEDQKRSIFQSPVRGLSFEDIITTLLVCRDEIEKTRVMIR